MARQGTSEMLCPDRGSSQDTSAAGLRGCAQLQKRASEQEIEPDPEAVSPLTIVMRGTSPSAVSTTLYGGVDSDFTSLKGRKTTS